MSPYRSRDGMIESLMLMLTAIHKASFALQSNYIPT